MYLGRYKSRHMKGYYYHYVACSYEKIQIDIFGKKKIKIKRNEIIKYYQRDLNKAFYKHYYSNNEEFLLTQPNKYF